MAATGIDRLIQWKKDNPTRAKEASRRWEKAHPQRFQQLLAWKKAHPQRTLQMRRNYHETHKEQDNEKVRAWRKTHQERVRELSARWQREHPERSRELARLRGRRTSGHTRSYVPYASKSIASGLRPTQRNPPNTDSVTHGCPV